MHRQSTVVSMVCPVWLTQVLQENGYNHAALLDNDAMKNILSVWDIAVLSVVNSKNNIGQMSKLTGLSSEILCHSAQPLFPWWESGVLSRLESDSVNDFDLSLTGTQCKVENIKYRPEIIRGGANDTIVLVLMANTKEGFSGEPLKTAVGEILLAEGCSIKDMFSFNLVK